MASTTAFTDQAKQDFLNGVHQPGDTYKIALFTSAATHDKTTTVYSATNEVTGTGYVAGGQTLTGFTVGIAGDVAYIDFDDPSWTGASVTAASAEIYNASKGNKVLAVINFGGDFQASAGTFTVQLPAPGATAIVRIA